MQKWARPIIFICINIKFFIHGKYYYLYLFCIYCAYAINILLLITNDTFCDYIFCIYFCENTFSSPRLICRDNSKSFVCWFLCKHCGFVVLSKHLLNQWCEFGVGLSFSTSNGRLGECHVYFFILFNATEIAHSSFFIYLIFIFYCNVEIITVI